MANNNCHGCCLLWSSGISTGSGRAIIICVALRTGQPCAGKASTNLQTDPVVNSTEQYPLSQRRRWHVQKSGTGLFAILFVFGIYLLLPTVFCENMDILSLCPRFFISVQTARLLCVDEAWLASRVFSSQPACQVCPRTKMYLWVSYWHCVGVCLDICLQPQKWKKIPQLQSLHNVMCAKSLVKWVGGFCFVSIQSNRKI